MVQVMLVKRAFSIALVYAGSKHLLSRHCRRCRSLGNMQQSVDGPAQGLMFMHVLEGGRRD